MTTTKKKAAEPQVKKSKMDEMFTLVKTEEGVKIAVGNYQVSKRTFEKWSDAEAYIAKKPYEILVNVTCLFVNLMYDQKKQNENEKTN